MPLSVEEQVPVQLRILVKQAADCKVRVQSASEAGKDCQAAPQTDLSQMVVVPE